MKNICNFGGKKLIMTFNNKLGIFIILGLIFTGCCSNKNSYDNNYIPFDIQGFDVFVYNNKTDKEFYAGHIETNYLNAQYQISNAQSLAYDYAEKIKLKDWDYLIYTVTSYSNCVTKIK